MVELLPKVVKMLATKRGYNSKKTQYQQPEIRDSLMKVKLLSSEVSLALHFLDFSIL